MTQTASDVRTLNERQAASLPVLLRALWYDAQGDWNRAHTLAQDEEGPAGAWVHAYLHRREGDAGNAAYWYRRAGRPVCTASLDTEWEAIVTAFLPSAAGQDAQR